MQSLTWDQVRGRRLERHHLLRPGPAARLADVAGEICGVHAQMAASAELMLGLRVRDITRRDVRKALYEDRSLVKTVGLRSTLHLFPAADLPVWMAANRLRNEAERIRREKAGVPMAEFFAVLDALSDVVDSEPRTRLEVEAEVARRAGRWAMERNLGWAGTYRNWQMALGWAASAGLLCQGPPQGSQATFVRPADWCGWPEADPDEAGLFVLRRFLHAYGPATPAEFSRWFNLEPPLSRRLFADLAGELAEVDVEGGRRWQLAGDGEAGQPTEAAHLLPQFDVFTVGSHPREHLIPPGSDVAAAGTGTAAPLAVVLVGGRVAGVWQRNVQGSRLHVRVGARVPLNRRQTAQVEAQAERVAEILELRCELAFGDVPLRWHL